MNRSYTLAFQCCGLSPGCIAQWSRRCDNSRQLSDYRLVKWSFTDVNDFTDFDERANLQGPRLQAELLEA